MPGSKIPRQAPTFSDGPPRNNIPPELFAGQGVESHNYSAHSELRGAHRYMFYKRPLKYAGTYASYCDALCTAAYFTERKRVAAGTYIDVSRLQSEG